MTSGYCKPRSLSLETSKSHKFSKINSRRATTTRRAKTIAPKAMLHELDLPSTAAAMDHMVQYISTVDDEILLRLLHVADAATAVATDAAANKPQDNGFLQPLVSGLESVLKYIQGSLDKFNVPYSYGWSIVALTALIKLATFPLVKQQVESTLAMQNLKPEIDKIKAKYGEDKNAVQRETSALYEKAGVNPLAGCLPTLATLPVFIGLYRSLSSVAQEGALDSQGFYWIPSLAGPTTLAAQKAGAGTAWLFPFVDGAPPIGWETASHYLVLPACLVIAQYISSAIISPPIDPNAENANTQKALYAFLPLMVGWFSLNVPAGLGLYYFSNTILTSSQQIFLRKLGGANVSEFDLGPIDLGKARRTGATAGVEEAEGATTTLTTVEGSVGEESGNGNGSMAFSVDMNSEGANMPTDMSMSTDVDAPAVPMINRRCKRKKRDLAQVA